MIGIKAYGGYIPRLRLERSVIAQSNAWYAPNMVGKGKGTKAMANWDEDTITMSVAAARDCLGIDDDRSHIGSVYLASTTFPFADRLNSGVLASALTLNKEIVAIDVAGSQRGAMSAVTQGLSKLQSDASDVLVTAADRRKARVASAQEMDYGDGASALVLGRGEVLAEFLGSSVTTDDFVDHFRADPSGFDYHWEERWVRDEGVSKSVPNTVKDLLNKSKVSAEDVTHFIFPTSFRKLDLQIAKRCGINPDAVVDSMAANVGNTGVAHGMLMLAKVLETAKPGDLILWTQFAQGVESLLFKVTDSIDSYKPKSGVSGFLNKGVSESSYTRYLAYNNLVELEKGMRGEQDKKTALSTAYRHRGMLAGFVAGKCNVTGEIHYPPTRLSYSKEGARLDTQTPYKLAERKGHIKSWSAEYLSYTMSPPNQYGMVDFVGGGRFLMEFTDVSKGDVDTGMEMEMVFRIKDIDPLREFKRYFWKATPVKSS